MTIPEFKADAERRAKLMLSLKDMREALECLNDNGPQHRPAPLGLSPTDANVRYGHVLGYAEYARNLWGLTEPDREAEQIEPTYEEPADGEEP